MYCPHCNNEIAEHSNYCWNCGARQAPRATATASAFRGKRLTRSATDVKIAGVCAGFAEYFDMDPTVVRLLWAILTILPVPIFPGVIGYAVAWIVMPVAPLPLPAPVVTNATGPRAQTT